MSTKQDSSGMPIPHAADSNETAAKYCITYPINVHLRACLILFGTTNVGSNYLNTLLSEQLVLYLAEEINYSIFSLTRPNSARNSIFGQGPLNSLQQ